MCSVKYISFNNQTPGRYPKDYYTQDSKHGESLKSRCILCFTVEMHEKKMAVTECCFEVAFRIFQAPGLEIFSLSCCG
jgi:hypothetical protein